MTADWPQLEEVMPLLRRHHRGPVGPLTPLRGGFWSSAYGYRVGDDDLVIRFAGDAEGFRKDKAAFGFRRPALPIPEVLHLDGTPGRAFAISRRAHGRFLEDLRPDEAVRSGPMTDRLLDGLRSVEPETGVGIDWFEHQQPIADSWRDWLRKALVEDPNHEVSGWRAKIASRPALETLFQRALERISEVVEHCPERRDLIHGDLLHQNVLISDEADEVTAIFSWKHSVLGDFLYDVAWLTFWAPWHPGIDAVDPWNRTTGRGIAESALHEAELRHHCYELHIGAQHLAWCSWTGNETELAAVSRRTTQILDRGPLTG